MKFFKVYDLVSIRDLIHGRNIFFARPSLNPLTHLVLQYGVYSLSVLTNEVDLLKGTMLQDFVPCLVKTSTEAWLQLNRPTRFREIFRLRKDIREKCRHI